jgi:hypothetical protein
MASLNHSDSKSASLDHVPHIYETFRPSEDFAAFEAEFIRPIIQRSHSNNLIYLSKLPDLPLPVSFTSHRRSIESLHQTFINTDINRPSREIAFPRYIAPIPNQSAQIPVLNRVLVHGQFSLKNPECFVVEDGGDFRFGDILVLGGHGIREVVVECIKDVGKKYVLYSVCEVGAAPINSSLTTHLVTPRSFFRPTFAQYLVQAVLGCFPCCFSSLEDFGEAFEARSRFEEMELGQTITSFGSSSRLEGSSYFSDSSSDIR